VAARAGVGIPRSDVERAAWFGDDAACVDYLDWLRWAAGFRCPHCGADRSWRLPDGRRSCAGCRRRISPTAGTVLHRARSPLPLWFAAAWALTAGATTSASSLQRDLGLGSYQTAWAMLHRLRAAMAAPGQATLTGAVDVGTVPLHGPRRVPGTGSGDGVLLAVAVERPGPSLGRCRLAVVDPATAADLQPFVRASVSDGSRLGARPGRPAPPSVHAVGALVSSWLLGPLHGGVEEAHLPAYLDEFAFRFDGRGPPPPGALFHRLLTRVVTSSPVDAPSLVRHPAPRSRPPLPPARPRRSPPRAGGGPPERPWRRP
jgi:predicted RNA-binding Zn-ribbon protein involved in translation (DUF1610 family)